MNTVFESGNLIKRIRDGKDLAEIAAFVRNRIYENGPIETVVLETLSYLKIFQPEYFESFEMEIIETMGLPTFTNAPFSTYFFVIIPLIGHLIVASANCSSACSNCPHQIRIILPSAIRMMFGKETKYLVQ